MTRKRTRAQRLRARRARLAPGPVKQVGLFVTAELDSAIEACREKVKRIARECRARNKRFRDLEFDVEFDEQLCLHGLSEYAEVTGKDVQRVTELFDDPHFFPVGGAASSNAIKQGGLGDCWFLSALATVSCVPDLIEQICVERDEEVGVYGFIFYGDHGWSSIIIDDMLYTNIPKFEELELESRELYHGGKEQYIQTARRHGASLLYAKSGSQDEMWVPLIEKAYAKFYGSFAHLERGWTREAMEDLTGGVATAFITKDILDKDRFWREELVKANKDRLFACSFNGFGSGEGGGTFTVDGLHGDHAYAILRAVECRGKRFVVLRNPWGKGEWTGAWSDGSKEWTPEWLGVLAHLDHTFGNDGQFVMDYPEFLRSFNIIERTYLFDDSWIVSSQWLQVPLRDQPAAWSFGTLSFVVTMPAKSNAILVLSQLNTRAFRSIRQSSSIMMDLAIVKKGEKTAVEVAAEARPFNCRNVSVELELDEGDYFVYVRLDQFRMISVDGIAGADYGYAASCRTLSRVLSRKVDSYSLAPNWKSKTKDQLKATTLEEVIQADLDQIALNEVFMAGTETQPHVEQPESSLSAADDDDDEDEHEEHQPDGDPGGSDLSIPPESPLSLADGAMLLLSSPITELKALPPVSTDDSLLSVPVPFIAESNGISALSSGLDSDSSDPLAKNAHPETASSGIPSVPESAPPCHTGAVITPTSQGVLQALFNVIRESERRWELISLILTTGTLNLLALFGLTIISHHADRSSNAQAAAPEPHTQSHTPDPDIKIGTKHASPAVREQIEALQEESTDEGNTSSSDTDDVADSDNGASIDSNSITNSLSPINSPTVQPASPARFSLSGYEGTPALSFAGSGGRYSTLFSRHSQDGSNESQGWKELLKDETDQIVLGLRVYTQTNVPAAIVARVDKG